MAKQNIPGGKKNSLFKKLEKNKNVGRVIENDETFQQLEKVQSKITSGSNKEETKSKENTIGKSSASDKSQGKNQKAEESTKEVKSNNQQESNSNDDKTLKRRRVKKYMQKNIELKEDTQVSIKIAAGLHRTLNSTVSSINVINKSKSTVFLQDLVNNILNDWIEKHKDEIREIKLESIDEP